MGPVESNTASNDFIVLIACLAFGFVVFILFKFVFGKNKKDEYQASNSYRPSATNQKQHHSETNTRTDRIIIKGHKFGVDESISIMEAIKNGNRVEAIWLIRTQPGISLKDAKFFVDKTEKNLAASPRQIETHTIEKPFMLNENKTKNDKIKPFVAKSNKVEISKAQFSTFIAALESDNKIAGVKVLREVSNISFKDAKDFVDHVLEKGHLNEITKENVDSAIKKILKQMNGEYVEVVKEVMPKSLPNKLSRSESESINNALENGNKIDAVRLFSDATGLGWNESNDYVQKLDEKRKEKLISNDFNSGYTALDNIKITSEAILNSIEGGSKIESIKLLRDATGLGLKESKDMIEKIESIIKSSPHKNEAIKNAKAELEKEINKVRI